MKISAAISLLALCIFVSCGREEPSVGFDLSLGDDRTILDNQKLSLLSGVEGAEYEWSTGEKTASIQVDTSGTYWVRVTKDGIVKSDTIVLTLAYRLAKVETSFGELVLWLHLETPGHKEAFLKLVNEGYFNDKDFNRVINRFVIQAGCPDEPDGFKDTSLFIAPEFRRHLRHEFGALGGGRDNNPGKMTNACQFYIVDEPRNRLDLNYLNMNYTIFGKVISDLQVVQDISKVETDKDDAPKERISITVTEVHFTAKELEEKFGFQVP